MPSVAELGAKVRAKYPGQYDDLDDATLGAKVKAKYPTAYSDFSDAGSSAAPQVPIGAGDSSIMTTRLPGFPIAPNDLPSVFGGLGGMVPGPAGRGLAAVGGIVGETARQGLGTMVGEEMNAGRIVGEGAKQAAFTAGGQLLGAGVRAVGGTITGRILNQAAAKTRTLYESAGKGGWRYHPKDMLAGIDALAEEVATLSPAAAARLKKVASDFMSNKGAAMTPIQVQRVKQLADNTAKKVFQAQKQRIPVSQVQDLRARFANLIGNNARAMLRRIPGAEELEAQTQKAIRARKLLPVQSEGPINSAAQLYTRTGVAGAAATVGGLAGGVPGAGIAGLSALALQNPQVLALLGKLLDSGAMQGVMQQAPRVGYELARER